MFHAILVIVYCFSLLGYPLAFLHRFLLYGKSPWQQHLYFTVCGIAICYFNFGKYKFHNMVLINWVSTLVYTASYNNLVEPPFHKVKVNLKTNYRALDPNTYRSQTPTGCSGRCLGLVSNTFYLPQSQCMGFKLMFSLQK